MTCAVRSLSDYRAATRQRHTKRVPTLVGLGNEVILLKRLNDKEKKRIRLYVETDGN